MIYLSLKLEFLKLAKWDIFIFYFFKNTNLWNKKNLNHAYMKLFMITRFIKGILIF